MRIIKKYDGFLIQEKYDKNIIDELKRLGVEDKEEINKYLYHAHRGNLGHYLNEKGDLFTFGMLNALFKDAQDAKKKTDLKIGFVKMLHRVTPIALAPFFPMIAIAGFILGSTRAFNKIMKPILEDPGKDYNTFLKKVVQSSMKIAEGEIDIKDRFTRAFVISDKLTEAIKPEVLQLFSIELSNKMSEMDPDIEVPDHYIENELKKYLNDKFEINPEIPLLEKIDSYTNKATIEDITDILNDILTRMEDETNLTFTIKNYRYMDDDVITENIEIIINNDSKFFGKHPNKIFKLNNTIIETIHRIYQYMRTIGWYSDMYIYNYKPTNSIYRSSKKKIIIRPDDKIYTQDKTLITTGYETPEILLKFRNIY